MASEGEAKKTNSDPLQGLELEWTTVIEEKAKHDINEITDIKERSEKLKELRDWLEETKYLKCPQDDDFLLVFLRHSKYDLEKACQKLDNYCTFYSSQVYGRPSWFGLFSNEEQKFNEVLKEKMCVVLGQLDEEGPLVLLHSMRHFNFVEANIELHMEFNVSLLDQLSFVPAVAVKGLIIVVDLFGVGVRDIMRLVDFERDKAALKLFQDALPLRLKQIIYFNEPAMFDAIMSVIERFMSSKMKSRLMRCKNDYEMAFKKYPGLRNLLPDEFAGDNRRLSKLYDPSNMWVSNFMKTYHLKEIESEDSKRSTPTPLARYSLKNIIGSYFGFK